MRKNKLWVFAGLLATLSCSGQRVESKAYGAMLGLLLKGDVPEVTVPEVDSLMRTSTEVVFIDARERKEYEVSHLPGALWVGYDDFDLDRMDTVDKAAKVVAYCSVGARSEDVTRKLIKAGFQDVSNLYGSIFEWVNQEHQVVDMDGEPTKEVHAYNKKWGIWLKKGKKVYD